MVDGGNGHSWMPDWDTWNTGAHLITNFLQATFYVLFIREFIDDSKKGLDPAIQILFGLNVVAGLAYTWEATKKYSELSRVYHYPKEDRHYKLLRRSIATRQMPLCKKLRAYLFTFLAAVLNGSCNGIGLYLSFALWYKRKNKEEDIAYSLILGLGVSIAQFYFFNPGEEPNPIVFTCAAIIQNLGKAGFQTFALYKLIEAVLKAKFDVNLDFRIFSIFFFPLLFVTHYNARVIRQQALDVLRKRSGNTNPFIDPKDASWLWIFLARVSAGFVAVTTGFGTPDKVAKLVGSNDAARSGLQVIISLIFSGLCLRNFLPLLELYNTIETKSGEKKLSVRSYCFPRHRAPQVAPVASGPSHAPDSMVQVVPGPFDDRVHHSINGAPHVAIPPPTPTGA